MASQHSSPRSGITIVEVLVALMLVAVGLLGVAGTSAITVRTSASAAREREAVERAKSRLSTLDAAGCAASSGSATPAHGMEERWSVAAARGGAALVDERIEWTTAGGTRQLLLRAAILC